MMRIRPEETGTGAEAWKKNLENDMRVLIARVERLEDLLLSMRSQINDIWYTTGADNPDTENNLYEAAEIIVNNPAFSGGRPER